ncbi:hypothetical protein, partial [Sinorhizobium meliloti]
TNERKPSSSSVIRIFAIMASRIFSAGSGAAIGCHGRSVGSPYRPPPHATAIRHPNKQLFV